MSAPIVTATCREKACQSLMNATVRQLIAAGWRQGFWSGRWTCPRCCAIKRY